MRSSWFFALCFAIFSNYFMQRASEPILNLHATLGQIHQPDQSRSCHHGRWLDLSQGAGMICYDVDIIHKARHYTEDTEYVVDNDYINDTTPNNDNNKVDFNKPRPDQWINTLFTDLKKARKLAMEIAEFAQELIKSTTAKSRQSAADQMRRSFKNMPFTQQERISQSFSSLHEVLENAAQLLERSGDHTTSTMQWVGVHGRFGKIPEQLLQETAQWLRRHDRDLQGNAAQALVDKTLSTVWFLLKIRMMVAPQTFWGPVLNKFGWGTRGVRKGNYFINSSLFVEQTPLICLGSAAAALHSKLNPAVAQGWFATAQSAVQNGYGKAVFDHIVEAHAAVPLVVESVGWEFIAKWFEETDWVSQAT